jgi:ATP-dependent Clp protease adaptor protein ClpS
MAGTWPAMTNVGVKQGRGRDFRAVSVTERFGLTFSLRKQGETLDISVMKDTRDTDNGNTGNGTGTGVVTKTRPKTKKPSLYKVLILNDDYTPMEFVVHILERFFNKGREEAVEIMLHVHRHGVGICGVFTYEVAETKVAQVIEFARRHQHPLQCTMEKE